MKKIYKIIALLTFSIVVLLGSFANGTEAASKRIVVAGSSALYPLLTQAQKEFKQKNPRVMINVTSSSSIYGPQSVTKGLATIGACDWDATKPVAGFKGFSDLTATPIAKIPFSTIVHKDNPVKNLSKDDLIGIFTGKITNWKEVGGNNEKIKIVNRKSGSGTRVNFQELALNGKEFEKNTLFASSSSEMKTNVASDKNAIGYIDLAYVSGNVKSVSIDKIAPTVANVKNGSYKIWGYGYLLTKGNPTGDDKKFIDYILSSKFQNGSLKKLKFLPLK